MRRHIAIAVGIATLLLLVLAPSAGAAFGVEGFDLTFTGSPPAGEPEALGEVIAQAGAHPFAATNTLSLSTETTAVEGEIPSEQLESLTARVPAGLVGDPTATPRCSGTEFIEYSFDTSLPACSDSDAVGVIVVKVHYRGQTKQNGQVIPPEISYISAPLYDLSPPPGAVQKLGFIVDNVPVAMLFKLVPEAPFDEVEVALHFLAQPLPIISSKLILWGDPASPSHDAFRGSCIRPKAPGHIEKIETSGALCPSTAPEHAFITLPRACHGPLFTTYDATSWLGSVADGESASALSPTGCGDLGLNAGIDATPSSAEAESPTGLDFSLNVEDPGLSEPEGHAGSDIEKAVVTLPQGITTNPSVASGLGVCGLAEYERSKLGHSACPESSKVGTVEVESPLIEEEVPGGGLRPQVLDGSIYIARQHENPFGSLLAIYMVIEEPELGIFIKLPGRVAPDPITGQLTTTFGEPEGLPQLPFSHFRLHFRGGSRAPLITPSTCGDYTAMAELYPYADPAQPVQSTATLSVSKGPGGGACQAPPNAVSFEAGTVKSTAGSYSPFVLRLRRDDGTQQLSRLTATLPKGLLGRIAGIPYCPEAAIASVAARGGEGEGALEQSSPSCPAASEVGTVVASAGAGPDPYYVNGHAYLAGPYNGAALSLEIITPAIAGPFDLGTVAVRTALAVDPLTSQITATSDPIPQILHGLPLDLRSISIEMGRPQFTLNPTSCEPQSIVGSVTSTLGSVASVSQRFEASDCSALRFKPTLHLSLKGSTKRIGHPALKAVITYPHQGAYANIARAQVNLPHAEFLDQANLNKTCTKPVLLEGKCPTTTIYGKAKAWTPLLEKPVEGPVYLVGGFGYQLPALVAELDGQIRVLLVGKVDSGRNHGIRSTFEAVPDAPVEKFELTLKGGPKYSLLVNSEDLCTKPHKAIARFTGQDGTVEHSKPTVAVKCGKKKSKK
jgi:hypothetical protein